MENAPDPEQVACTDARASEGGSSQSAASRELREAAQGAHRHRSTERMVALEGGASGHGGTAVEDLKAGRPG